MTCLASLTLTTQELHALDAGMGIPGLLEEDGFYRCELRGPIPAVTSPSSTRWHGTRTLQSSPTGCGGTPPDML